MHVIFSDHAKLRCKEQGISQGYVYREVKNMPPITGRVHWRTRHKHMLVVDRKNESTILVVTVVSNKKQRELSSKKRRREQLKMNRNHKR